MYQQEAIAIKEMITTQPKIAIVLGSGLGGLVSKVQDAKCISYSKINTLPVSTAPSHNGRFVFGELGGKDVVLMDGRVHLYEGYTPQQVVAPIRLLKAMGVDTIILTNAAGGINRELCVGDFMLIEDHISLFVPSPLIGKNDDSVGTRFPDMSNAYNKELRQTIIKSSMNIGINLKRGVYAQLTGPQFESPAEIKALSNLGADAVGMSTVIESIAANHCGMRVAGISMIANLACGILDKPLSGEDVNEAARQSENQFESLITEIVRNI
ncbi:MAG: purine-nucleoside phosphorylase [Eubacterium sp.]